LRIVTAFLLMYEYDVQLTKKGEGRHATFEKYYRTHVLLFLYEKFRFNLK